MTELSPPRKIILMRGKNKALRSFYKEDVQGEEEEDKGRHVDVDVPTKGAVAPTVSLTLLLRPAAFCKYRFITIHLLLKLNLTHNI